MRKLGTKCHLSACRLRDASILDDLTFFVRLKPRVISKSRPTTNHNHSASLFDGKLSALAVVAHSLVDSSVGTAADETDDLVPIEHSNFAGIAM